MKMLLNIILVLYLVMAVACLALLVLAIAESYKQRFVPRFPWEKIK